MKIDAHQHFWIYDAARHGWIDARMAALKRDFLPQHLQPLLVQNGMDGCVAVQAAQTEAETEWLLHLAAENAFIKGVVGWVDLQAKDIAERLQHFAQDKKLKGFRHIVQAESDPSFLARPAFLHGISLLQKFGFTYDILIYPHQLHAAVGLVSRFPHQPFVLDHGAKPYIQKGLIDTWYADLKKLAAHQNVSCKISGLVTEADWQQWTPAQLEPYIDAALHAFGPQRVLFGSDWPVCLLAASYAQVADSMYGVLKKFNSHEQALFWGGNAAQFYNLQ